ncbi:CGNR zinc finger domain-containing protein [Mycolicibacterium sp. F2034L]|uniref:CGNR zinc finger domain-containing protein n=1 Tax=Mycolicibacterium sp. F2034L TaxID=2926422 RepID=UPI001FF13241|nr:CGNR zinc finger domain-containing protein [Mycolicibacterium sp. F2034L]MCK0173611.1 CGNR zinc finger domain-containing protein [Mycolicibacterium sp. F2034L]
MTEDEVIVDLLNTKPVVDGRVTELLDERWLTAHNAGGIPVGAARGVRDDLQRVVRGEAGPETLQPYLRDVRRIPRATADGIEWSTEAGWAARVVLAWGELERALPGRLRPCANDECRLFLLDRSRAGRARWCSMQGCGNRMKARRHYDRVRNVDRPAD